ncbi:MAG: 3',5'-cyclic-nucleotide phosphodiesterase [Nitrospirae bacterium]|nr:3',5'-cyclic-nucleotide phosphodiesterase [Nitrospirota bacterium]
MRIKALGCYGAEFVTTDAEGKTTIYNTSGFLINRSVIIDAGTISTSLNLSELVHLRHVLLSHIHFDHIKGLPFLADTVFGKLPVPIEIHSLDEILTGLHEHLLNDTVWPDFTKLPNADQPTFRLSELKEESSRTLGDLKVIPVRVNHIVPTVGFIVEDPTGAVLYSGDTHETKRIWEVASKITRLKAAIIETSFPNDLHGLAVKSGHLTPRLLAQEFAKIGRPDIPLYVYHMKPQYVELLTAEIKALKIPNVRLLRDGQTFTV